MRDKVTRQYPQTTTFKEKVEPKQIGTEAPLLTSLTAHMQQDGKSMVQSHMQQDGKSMPMVQSHMQLPASVKCHLQLALRTACRPTAKPSKISKIYYLPTGSGTFAWTDKEYDPAKQSLALKRGQPGMCKCLAMALNNGNTCHTQSRKVYYCFSPSRAGLVSYS